MSEKLSREQVREALAEHDGHCSPVIAAAAQAWLDQGDALVIRKDENGEWPDDVVRIVRESPGEDRRGFCLLSPVEAVRILDALVGT